MRVEVLLVAMMIAGATYAADELAPLSLEFLEFLGDNGEQAELAGLLIEAEGGSETGSSEAGVYDDE